MVDRDNTPLTRMLAESLAGKNRIIDLVDETQIRSALAEGKADYVLVIEPGFTTAILKNREPVIRGYSIRESNTALPVKINLAGFISAARTIAAAADGDEGLLSRYGLLCERQLYPGQSDSGGRKRMSALSSAGPACWP